MSVPQRPSRTLFIAHQDSAVVHQLPLIITARPQLQPILLAALIHWQRRSESCQPKSTPLRTSPLEIILDQHLQPHKHGLRQKVKMASQVRGGSAGESTLITISLHSLLPRSRIRPARLRDVGTRSYQANFSTMSFTCTLCEYTIGSPYYTGRDSSISTNNTPSEERWALSSTHWLWGL